MNMIRTMQQMPSMNKQIIFDLESTGLLRQGSRIHCIVMRGGDNGDTSVFDHRPEQSIIQGVKELEQADVLIGHNIIGYDIPLIKEQFPEFNPQGQAIDTLVLSRLFYPHIADRDYERRPHGMPQRLYGRHSLRPGAIASSASKAILASTKATGLYIHPRCSIIASKTPLKLWALMKRRMEDYS